VCPPPQVAADERCNALDDDCDGATDEGFDVGSPCAAGVGACHAIGRVVCLPSGDTVCDAVPGPGGAERCNGVDDDCDGHADEGYPLGERCLSGVGACAQAGELVCDGLDVVCSASPGAGGPETCDGYDDDCDGTADEDFGVGHECFEGVGACRRGGHLECDDGGARAVCSVFAGSPAPEACNGADDDCDGHTDEDFLLGQPCGGLDDELCLPVGHWACDGNGGARCAADFIPSLDDNCDGRDDDCDFRTDEGAVDCPQ
jgi:hypothetical protein